MKEVVTVYDFEYGEDVMVYGFDEIVESKVLEGLGIDFKELRRYLYE